MGGLPGLLSFPARMHSAWAFKALGLRDPGATCSMLLQPGARYTCSSFLKLGPPLSACPHVLKPPQWRAHCTASIPCLHPAPPLTSPPATCILLLTPRLTLGTPFCHLHPHTGTPSCTPWLSCHRATMTPAITLGIKTQASSTTSSSTTPNTARCVASLITLLLVVCSSSWRHALQCWCWWACAAFASAHAAGEVAGSCPP